MIGSQMAFQPNLSRLRALSLLVVVAIIAGAGSARAQALMPHRASYVLSMIKADGRSGIVDVRGALIYEMAEACDGWTVSHRMRIQLTHQSGREIAMETDFSSWETKDGREFRFESSSLHNGKSIEHISGRAELKGPGKGGEAIFSTPKKHRLTLPPGTLFPVAHTAVILKRALAGERLTWKLVFDGTSDDGLYGVNAFVGAPAEPQSDSPVPLYGERRSWPLKLAYFTHGKDTPEPLFELAMRLNEVGISDDMVIDYGRFSLNAKLKQVEALPKPNC